MPGLISPHGGLSEPICRTVAANEQDAFLAEARTLPTVPVSAADLSTVYRFGDGTLSPLTGPMNSAVYHQVLDECFIESNGARYAWTIPLAFPVTAELAKTLKPGQKVALTAPSGEIVATLEINDVYAWPKLKYLRSVYLTDRIDHPGADMVIRGEADKSHLIGGEIRVLPQPKTLPSAAMCSHPAKSASCSPKKAGTPSSPSKLATRCTALTNTPSSTASKPCSEKATTPAPA
ncbi:MAG: Sulfate adenylyltransferase [Planctomycetota bacterium]